MLLKTIGLVAFLVSGTFCGLFDTGIPFDTNKCSLSASLLSEIKSYKVIADRIFNETTQHDFKDKTYSDLSKFVKEFGSRLSGSVSLEKSLNYLRQKLRSLALSNITAENVKVPKLKRRVEIGNVISPYKRKLGLLGIGNTVSTPILGLVRDIIFIKSGDTITKEVSNKIAAFDVIGANTSSWRTAESLGAAAILLRAIVTDSNSAMYTKVGIRIGDTRLKIPVAFITNDDMDTLRVVSAQGRKPKVYINIQHTLTQSTSKNVYGDLKGKTKPDESVIISGHADSWDLSESASDDGIGVILSYQVQALLQKLQLIPKRTLRTVFWTAEEFGLIGATAYVGKHKDEISKLSTVLEADKGCFGVSGWTFGGPAEYGCILGEILKLMEDTIGPMPLSSVDTSSNPDVPSNLKMSTDVAVFFPSGVPGAALNGDTKNYTYYKYHHTRDDTIRVVDSQLLDKCLALYATTAYVIADLTDSMPRIVTTKQDWIHDVHNS